MNTRQNTLTEGSIWKQILLFAFPIFLGNVFQQFYNAFDSWAVGNFIGDNALAAVSSSGSLIFMMVGFLGTAMGFLLNLFTPEKVGNVIVYSNKSYLAVFGMFFLISVFELYKARKLSNKY